MRRLRRRNHATNSQIPIKENMTAPVIMTTEQLEALIGNITQSLGQRVQIQPAPGNFAACASRFAGNKNEDVEAFINAITIYKNCVNVSDENALKGLAMLLDNNAATWWQGLQATVNTWEEAIVALKHAYSISMPAHKVYKELFSNEQGNEPTDIFVNKCRALIARLHKKPELHIVHQLDMVYCLLNRRIRCLLPRDDIQTFSELIEKARAIEESFEESNSVVSKTKANVEDQTKRRRPQCDYCKNFGHIKTNCRNYAADQQKATYKLHCYGCGTPGYIRSQCPKCQNQKDSNNLTQRTHNSNVDVLYTEVDFASTSRPMLEVTIAGKHGLAFIDTGARNSMAGSVLFEYFCKTGLPYEETDLQMVLADGLMRKVRARLFEVEVFVQGRQIITTFFAIPDHIKSKTLLGIDFILKAQIIINIPKFTWSFQDDNMTFDLFNEPTKQNGLALAQVNFHLREVDGKNLSTEEKNKLAELLQSHTIIFEKSSAFTPYAEHNIQLTDDTPIFQPPYRVSPAQKEVLRKLLDELQNDSIIEECESPYAFPVVLVPKPDGSRRLCVDYRRLNAITVPVQYPLPRIDDLLHSTSQAVYITTLDLRSGYHQIPVKEEDKNKTAFTTSFGTFRYNVMPFGLRTAPATFQRLIERFRSGLPHISMLAYLDDIIIMSPTFEKHLKDLDDVFQRLKLFKLHVNRAKCVFSTDQVKYLGHMINKDGFSPCPSKIASITEMRSPQNVKEVLSFLQTCSWFRRFVPNFAEVSRPLSQLTRKNMAWKWSTLEENAFRELKNLLTTSPILKQADPTKPFIVRTDASSYALGAALLQGEGADEKPIEYASCLLTDAQKNYHTTEREALAVVWAFEKFRGYIESSPVIVKSDHQPLRWLMSLKSPSGRLARWALSLQPYDLQIEYVPGKQNALADTLSRPFCHNKDTTNYCDACFVTVNLPLDDMKKIREAQLSDVNISAIIHSFETPETSVTDVRRWSDRGYLMLNGILYRYNPDCDSEEAQQVVPKCSINTVLKETHDSPLAGHYGVDRTLQKILPRYYWLGMRKDVAAYVAQCIECQRYKCSNLKPSGLLQTPIQAQRFETIAIDLFGPLPETPAGERWVFIVEDTSTRWMEMFPLKDATAQACSRCLIDEIVLRYGTPRRVISDNGVQFVGEIMQCVAHTLGFSQKLIPAYHPSSNPVERKNRDQKTQLAILTASDHTSWKEKLPSVRFAMNTTICQSTGYTPAYLTFGRELRTPDDVRRDFRAVIENDNFVPQITPYLRLLSKTLSEARENHEVQQDVRKFYADSKRRDVNFHVSDLVMVNSHVLSSTKAGITSKFTPRRDGPYKISRIVSPTSYEIVSVQNPSVPLGVYHVSALTKYVAGPSEITSPVPVHPIRRRGRPKVISSPVTSTSSVTPSSVSNEKHSIKRKSSRVRLPKR